MNAQAEEVASATKAKAAAASEKVTMQDGRVVEFVGKRKMLKESIIESKTVRLDFKNGGTVSFVIPDELLVRFALHGAEQKLGDETAGTEDVDDMQLDVEELVGRLNKGEWSAKREGSGMGGVSLLIKALTEVFPNRTVEYLKEYLKGKKPVERTALENSPKVKPIIDRLKAEKASKAANVDTDALLSDLA
jgi:hypothetical protein